MLRTVLYLAAVLPVTWAFAFVAALPAAISMPPDILQQSLLTVPIFVIVGGWLGGKVIPLALIPPAARDTAATQRATRFILILHGMVCLVILAAAATGLATPRQSVLLAAALILAGHTIAVNWLRGQ